MDKRTWWHLTAQQGQEVEENMKASTDRPAWTTTLFQGIGKGLEAFKHRIVRKSQDESMLIRDYCWTAEADKVRNICTSSPKS